LASGKARKGRPLDKGVLDANKGLPREDRFSVEKKNKLGMASKANRTSKLSVFAERAGRDLIFTCLMRGEAFGGGGGGEEPSKKKILS